MPIKLVGPPPASRNSGKNRIRQTGVDESGPPSALAAGFNAKPLPTGHLDVKGEQSIEQLGLAIKMMLAEPAARYLFAAVLK
jgi:hypothetical protein